LVLLIGGGTTAMLAAHASVSGHTEWTQKGNGAVAGYFAHSPSSGVDFTHVTSYIGNDGGSDQEQLQPATVTGNTVTGTVNGVGLGLCNQGNGSDAQIGQVYIGGGLVDIVWAVGSMVIPAINNGDPCQDGLVSNTANILIPNVPVNSTVELDILYDGNNGYSWHGRHHSAGTITFSATDLSDTPGTTVQASQPADHGTEFNEADMGAVADATFVNPLTGTVPFADVSGSPNLLATFAHLSLDGNYVNGSGEAHGSGWSNPAWTTFAVAATKNGGAPNAGNPVYLGPGIVRYDHARIYVGQPVG
jgi:hypothetical protein